MWLRSRGPIEAGRRTRMAEEKDDKPKKDTTSKKKGKRKEETRKAGFTANVEEGLKAIPARLRDRYRKEVVSALMKEFGFKNPNQVPKLEKIVVNMGLG